MIVEQVHLSSLALRQLIRRALEAIPDPVREAEIDAAFLDILDTLSLGNPFTFIEQHGGDFVQNIRPVASHEEEQSSRGRVALDLHTDDAFLDPLVRVEYIALCGVDNPAQVPTEVVAVCDVCEELSAEAIEVLSQPLFSFGCPESYDIVGRENMWTAPKPILTWCCDGLAEIAFPSTSVKVRGDESANAPSHLEALKAGLKRAPRRQITLEPGEILVISNTRCLHGRPSVANERWLKRVYLRRDLSALDLVAATDQPGVYIAALAAGYG